MNLTKQTRVYPPHPPFEWLGRQMYEPVWWRMQARAATIANGKADEAIWACEHAAVYTTGRRTVDNRMRPGLPAPFVKTDRGGETTFHGPGQIVLYPVIHLRRRGIGVRDYVHLLEQSCIDLLEGFGIKAQRRCALPGVWVNDAKIAAIGIRISRGVAYHGMALNVDVEEKWFAAIDPCGAGLPVINLAAFGAPPPPDKLAAVWYAHFCSQNAFTW